jgi:hypothetical protein
MMPPPRAPIGKSAAARDLALRHMRGGFPISRMSGYPAIAGRSVDRGPTQCAIAHKQKTPRPRRPSLEGPSNG